MSAPGAGHEFPAQEVSWQKRDVLLFANSIGCKADELHFLYVRKALWLNICETFDLITITRSFTLNFPSSQLIPLFFVRSVPHKVDPKGNAYDKAAFKLTDQEVTDFYARQGAVQIPGVPKLDYRHAVDGQRKLTVLKLLPPTSAGRKFELRNKVVGVYDKGKPGTVLETEQTIVDKECGDVYSKVLSSGFLVGQGNWGGPKGERSNVATILCLTEYPLTNI